MLKWNLGWVTGKTEPMEKFGKLNWQNFCVSGFPSEEYQHRPLWKNWKMAAISLILDHMEKFPTTNPPPKVWVSGFLSVDGNWISIGHYQKKLCRTADIRDANFLFLNFPLVHFPPSPILGCISTFMCGLIFPRKCQNHILTRVRFATSR